jgi:general transcription factor 3C polypeptide 5 (transcription factor C subunit 1)
MARSLQSTSSVTNNILLRVTVPKWTGRKRKRGSDEPFTDSSSVPGHTESERRDAKTRLRNLRDNVGKYTVEAVGRVERTHVFRGKYLSDDHKEKKENEKKGREKSLRLFELRCVFFI